MDRARSTVSDYDLPAASDVRERVLDLLEQAVDRVSDAVEEAPDPRSRALEAARSVGRNTRRSELATAAIVAGAPAVARAIAERVAARRAPVRSTVKAVPAVVLSRPALIGMGIGAVALGGLLAVRFMRRRGSTADEHEAIEERSSEESSGRVSTTGDQVDEAIARMQDEGGDPGDAEHAQAPSRRFVRSGDSDSAPTR